MKKTIYLCNVCSSNIQEKGGSGFKYYQDHNEAATIPEEPSKATLHLCNYCIGMIAEYNERKSK